jgi:hypothetical protein
MRKAASKFLMQLTKAHVWGIAKIELAQPQYRRGFLPMMGISILPPESNNASKSLYLKSFMN